MGNHLHRPKKREDVGKSTHKNYGDVGSVSENLDNLFNHSGFRLIFIDDNGNMSLEGPFDEKSRKKVKEYRCISHVWKTASGDHVWKDHGITNVTWKVEVREEKRERLFQIFNHHRGYFWMDVFCTNQEDENKPLDVMGEIYRNCVECICMLDMVCDVKGFTSERDLLTSLAKNVREYERVGYVRRHEEFSMGKYGDYLYSLKACKWSQRVWTWQEAVLPPRLLFCSEEAEQYRYDPFDHEFLKELFSYKALGIGPSDRLVDTTTKRYEFGHRFASANVLDCFEPITNIHGKQNVWRNLLALIMSKRKCTEKEDYVYGITGILNLDIPKGLTIDRAIIEFEKGLQKQGIFIEEKEGYGYFRENIYHLGGLFGKISFTDGIIVLGKVDTTLFNSGVVWGYKNYGRILTKESRNNRTYKHVCWKYTTETSIIYFETGKYNIGDVLETTKISRKGCTFQRIEGREKDEIFEIIGGRVKVIGYIDGTFGF